MILYAVWDRTYQRDIIVMGKTPYMDEDQARNIVICDKERYSMRRYSGTLTVLEDNINFKSVNN